MSGAPATQGDRGQIDFASVDSAPKRFAGAVPIWRAPAMLALFTALAAFGLWSVNTGAGAALFPNRDLMFSPYEGHHSIAIRIFMVAFFVSFAAFCSAGWRARLALGADMVLSYGAICALLDLANLVAFRLYDVALSLHFSAVVSGLLGFCVYAFKLLERGRMPVRIPVAHRALRNWRAVLRLAVAATVAVAASAYVGAMDFALVETLRSWTLLGGIGPGVFLVLPALFTQLYLLALWDMKTAKAKAPFAPPVSIIVPAHNEEYIIGQTIEAMDRAAARYGGEVEVLVMNNNSTDRTEAIAKAALARCSAARGRVIDVPKPGKSNALNAGLDAVETEYVVRVDADTLMGEENLRLAMAHFADPTVGIVGGVPVPPGGAPFDRARLLEVLIKHGFYSVAVGSVNGLVGVPGMFVAYRTGHPRQLGGFVEGMNGEDTDMSLRIAELGHRSVVDPKIRYVSEVPSSYAHMREQRMRWFRSVYHVSSRCRDLIYGRHMSLRGKIVLPYMLVNSARRTMLVPLVIFGSLECAFGFNPNSPIVWQSVVAVTTGAPALMAVAAALLNGVPKGVLALPEYLLFRVLRAYFTLESMMSILVGREREAMDRATLRNLLPDGPVRVA
jgi:cellulose synthase/poly-beta-1,6-N-acetylglucosamine synthase-like glycosyltransferase